MISPRLDLVGALAASRFLSTLLFGVTPTHPSTYAGVLAILATVGLAACYIPARQGSRLDPKTVLRSE